MTENTDFECEV